MTPPCQKNRGAVARRLHPRGAQNAANRPPSRGAVAAAARALACVGGLRFSAGRALGGPGAPPLAVARLVVTVSGPRPGRARGGCQVTHRQEPTKARA
jgi:hypothetical protein